MEGIILENIFANTTVISKELITDVCKNNFKYKQKKIRIVALIVAAACLMNLILSKKSASHSVIYITTFIIMVFVYFYGYLLQVNSLFKTYLGIFPFREMNFTFSQNNFGLSNQFGYEQITEVLETQQLYLIYVVNSFYIMYKEGFTTGESKDFIPFIKSKCTDRTKFIKQ